MEVKANFFRWVNLLLRPVKKRFKKFSSIDKIASFEREITAIFKYHEGKTFEIWGL